MKKSAFLNFCFLLGFVSLLCGGLLVGCARPSLDEYGCFQTLDAAITASKKSGHNIVVIATMEGDDAQSSDFMDSVVRADDFSAVKADYSLVLMDFSRKSFDATQTSEDADKTAVKAAAEKERIMQENALSAKLLNVSLTPSFYLLTKEGCFVSELDFIDDINSPADFIKLIESQSEKLERVNALIQNTRTGSSQERLLAVNELYDSTDPVYRPFLTDFIEKGIKLAGQDAALKSKFLIALTDARSTKDFLSGNTAEAVQGYVKLADNKKLTPQYRQQAWYMAGYLLAMSDSSQYDLIIQYFQKAIQAAPESNDAVSIQRALNEITGN
ncbi:MAG: hypothetical protein IJ688_09060 [Treponema sp.]|nr:hypothetical protein [Treponema sp.]